MPQFKAMTQSKIDHHFMTLALKQAELAEQIGEVPVGALIVKDSEVISVAYNTKESTPSALRHAELIAIELASKKLGLWRLTGCTLYVTLEPCIMCAGGMVSSRISRLVYGATDPKAGAVGSVFDLSQHGKLNHKFDVTKGIMQPECSQILKNFFSKRRK